MTFTTKSSCWARQEKKPVAQVIRERLGKGLRRGQETQTIGNALQELAELGETLKLKGPRDLSTNIDKYLYEE